MNIMNYHRNANNLEIGPRIVERRNELKLTQPDLSELTGLSVNYICQIENGRKPSLTALGKIADALNVSPGAFFDNSTKSKLKRIIDAEGVESLLDNLKEIINEDKKNDGNRG